MSSSCVFSDHFFISVPVSGIRRSNSFAPFQTQFFHSSKLGHRRSFHSSRPCVLAGMELIPPCESAGFANINIINTCETREAWSCQRRHVSTHRPSVRGRRRALSLAGSSIIPSSLRNPSFQELIPKFHSVNLSVLRA